MKEVNSSYYLCLVYKCVCVCIAEKHSEFIAFWESSVSFLSVCEDISTKQKTTVTLIFREVIFICLCFNTLMIVLWTSKIGQCMHCLIQKIMLSEEGNHGMQIILNYLWVREKTRDMDYKQRCFQKTGYFLVKQGQFLKLGILQSI